MTRGVPPASRSVAGPGPATVLPALGVCLLSLVPHAWGQTAGSPGPQAPPSAEAGARDPAPPRAPADADQDAVDREIRKVEPDFSVIALPSTLRVPRHAGAFRLTHRFTRALNAGGFGSLASDLFGLDGGAVIGLEFRFGLARGLQAGVYRTSDRTIELFGQYDLFQQRPSRPVGLNLLVGIEGADNFTEAYSPILGLVLSRTIGDRLALYAQPVWVGQTRSGERADTPDGHHGDGSSTTVLGLGLRARLGGSAYAVIEVAPRLAGYASGDTHVSIGIEKRAGGHVFQLNVSNGAGTTPAQIARGSHSHGKSFWFLGFNLSRKFY